MRVGLLLFLITLAGALGATVAVLLGADNPRPVSLAPRETLTLYTSDAAGNRARFAEVTIDSIDCTAGRVFVTVRTAER